MCLFALTIKHILKILYNIFIKLYPLVAFLISNRNKKAKLWVQGRKNIFDRLKMAFSNNNESIIWIHCSSLGEFEQGRPVIDALKLKYSKYKILLTFFSPSGFEVQKNYENADWVFYLPIDSPKNAQQFFDIVQPKFILFIKYEFWHYYLQEAKRRNIAIILISGVFRNTQPFFKWYGSFYKEILFCFNHFFVQNETSNKLLNQLTFTNVTICGDTRFDRVLQIAENFKPLEEIEFFIGDSKVIVAGSTWIEDDETLIHFLKANTTIKSIIAPHNINNERLKECLGIYKNAILYSDYIKSVNDYTKVNCLIIDNIGMLSRLYKYATIAYIGGGFGNDGIHNILEAAVYGKPLVFGPEYEKFIEAEDLIEQNGAISIDSAIALEEALNKLLKEESYLQQMAENAKIYVYAKGGATEKIMNYIYENRLLTN